MIQVTFGVDTATIDAFAWTSKNAALASLLNTMFRSDWLSPSVPDADYAAAQDAMKRLGGRMIGKYVPPKTEKGRIY